MKLIETCSCGARLEVSTWIPSWRDREVRGFRYRHAACITGEFQTATVMDPKVLNYYTVESVTTEDAAHVAEKQP